MRPENSRIVKNSKFASSHVMTNDSAATPSTMPSAYGISLMIAALRRALSFEVMETASS